MVNVRAAAAGDFERVAAFYRASGYRPVLTPSDTFVVAEDEAGICGAVRLCAEEDVLVLRGMRVAPAKQRGGIGTQLLEGVRASIGERSCYCIPHRHLRDFYDRAGFEQIAIGEAPLFLQDRWRQYTEEYGLDVILMRRTPNVPRGPERSARTV
jgi:N-acetylglutamate synthase-like GNAT family acetyltransferase